MKLKAGQSCFKMPAYSSIHGAWCIKNAHHIALAEIHPGTLAQMKPRAAANGRGTPVYIAFNGQQVEVWPVADRDYTITILYAPPLVEF